MPNSPAGKHQNHRNHTTDGADTTADNATENPPKRRRGGQELPDSVQDRPEQNAGYDAAVRGGPSVDPDDALGLDVIPGEDRADIRVVDPDTDDKSTLLDIDERAERGAIADVRRQDRSADNK